MLVIVQNPGMSTFSFTDDQADPEGAFNVPSFDFYPQKTTTISSAPPPPPSFPLPKNIAHIHHSPHSSSSLPEHQGPQLRARSSNISGDPILVSTAPPPNESGEFKDTNTTGGNKNPDNNNNNNDLPSVYANSNSKNEVVVDVKGLTSYASSFLPFERASGDSRLLHSRSNSALNSHSGFSSPHPSSIV